MPTIIHQPIVLQPKDPVLALLLSLFPGGGQIYNGHLGKALLVILTYPWSLLVGLAPYDAYRSARRHNEFLEMLESRTPPQIGGAEPQTTAIVAFRKLAPRPEEPPRGNFHRIGLLAILGAVLAASAVGGGLSVPVILGATLAVVGASLTFAASRERQVQAERALADARSELQAQAIGAAAQRGGRLTLGHVVEATKLGIEEAEQFMESLAMAGPVELVVEDNGGLTYEFPDLLRLAPASSGATTIENAVLAFARKSGGRITLGELALEVGLPLRDLRHCLTHLCADGFAEEVEEQRRTVYVFHEFVRS